MFRNQQQEKMPSPKIFGSLNFQLKNPNRSNCVSFEKAKHDLRMKEQQFNYFALMFSLVAP